MPNETIAGVKSGTIERIAEQLGVAAQEVFRIVTEAQPVLGLMELVTMVLWWVLIAGFLYYSYRWAKETSDEWDSSGIGDLDKPSTWRKEEATFVVALATVIFAVILLGVLFTLHDALVKILLPEYSALKEIAEYVR